MDQNNRGFRDLNRDTHNPLHTKVTEGSGNPNVTLEVLESVGRDSTGGYLQMGPTDTDYPQFPTLPFSVL